jgi:hypothetical protein
MEPQTGLDTDRVKEAIDSGKLAENRRKTGANPSSDYTELTNLRWKTIPGFSGYFVSEQGNLVKDCGDGKMLLLSPFKIKTGYWVAQVNKDGKRFVTGVHRLVARAFIGECPEGLQVAHGDGNPVSNHFTNLRYATPKENTADMIAHGNHWKHNRRAMTDEMALQVLDMVAKGVSRRSIAKQLGLNVGTVNGIVYGRTYTDLTTRY